MPLIAGTRSAPPAAPVLTAPTATWYAPDGTVIPLMDPEAGWVTIHKPEGLDDSPTVLTSDPHPRGGARARHRQPQPRTIVWPMRVWGDSSEQLLQRWRALEDAFTQTEELGPGVLEVVRPGGGGPRRIKALYQDGFDDDIDRTSLRQAVITLYCEDRHWYSPTPVTIRREHAIGVDFLDPFPSVSNSQVLGVTSLHNPGQVTAWPEWVITGPATQITATLTATGQSWTLTPGTISGTLAAGDELRVSTDPPQVRYHPSGGGPVQVWTGALNWPDASLWGLPRGRSDVEFQVDGADETTSITLSFLPRYKTT